jgi:mRNA interferase RelE/StbE
MDLLIHDSAGKGLESLDKNVQSLIKDHLKQLSENPYSNHLDTRKLKGLDKKPDLFRLRVGEYRIIYFIENNKIWVTDITRRERAYDF